MKFSVEINNEHEWQPGRWHWTVKRYEKVVAWGIRDSIDSATQASVEQLHSKVLEYNQRINNEQA